MTLKQQKLLFRILASSALLVLLLIIPVTGVLRFAAFLGVYLIIGYDILRKAARGIVNGRIFDECFLMSIATVGAFVLAVYTESGDYTEAIAVMLFYRIGELFESCAIGRSRKSISALMDIRPDTANLLKDGSITVVSPEAVEVGDIIVVSPGEKVPIDGVVVQGSSALNTAALTGESAPRDIGVGSCVLSGTVNLTGVIHLRTEKPFGQSTASKILALVENASSRKSVSESFISKFARVYTPAVCISALLLFLLPPVLSLLLSASPAWDIWLYRSLTFLVVSCPCALVISVPLTFFAGIGGAGKSGILVKGSVFLEALAGVDTVVMDKTGTVTEGTFCVTEIHAENITEDMLLYYAAHTEQYSSHPIASGIVNAYGKPLGENNVTCVKELAGLGVTGNVDGVSVACGNRKLMEHLGISFAPETASGTVLYLSADGEYCGCLVVSDVVKSEASQAINALKCHGIKSTVMLTGDIPTVAREVASTVGINEFYASLLPENKVSILEGIISKSAGKVAFVGDGINDAPVLTRADVGIAMGGVGSDAAIEAADVVIMDDDLNKLPKAIKISRKCMGIVYQNIVFALSVKLLCLVLSIFGVADMWLAVFADVGVMVLAVLNALRALKTE